MDRIEMSTIMRLVYDAREESEEVLEIILAVEVAIFVYIMNCTN